MGKTKVILCRSGDYDPDQALVDDIKENFSSVDFIDIRSQEFHSRENEMTDADVFVGWPNDEQLAAMPSLRWIYLPSAGANAYTDRQTVGENVMITNSSGVFGVPGAEHAIALMLALTRELHIHFNQQKQKIWKRNPICLEVQDSNVGIIGLGDIGGEIAKRAKGLGAHVTAVRRHASECPPYVDRMYPIEQLDTLLAESDFVFMALPLTDETKGFLHRERIQKMKKGAVFINVGRGPTVDEPALIEALQYGNLTGAGLDVTDEEPLPNASPLWDMPNVLITSHSVGVSPRKEERRMKLLSENLKRFLAGEELINLVDRKAGY